MSNGVVELRLKAATDDFNAQMKASSKSVKDFRQSIDEIGKSTQVMQSLSRSVSDVASGFANGDIGKALSGIAGGVQQAAVAVPTLVNSFQGMRALATSLAPIAPAIGGIGLAVGAVAGVAYMATEAWKSYNAELAAIDQSYKNLEGRTAERQKMLAQEQGELTKLRGQLENVGLDAHDVKLRKATAAYDDHAQSVFGLSNRLDELKSQLATASGFERDAVQVGINDAAGLLLAERERMRVASATVTTLNQIAEAEAKAAKAAERAAEAKRRYAEEQKRIASMSDWGATAGVEMDFDPYAMSAKDSAGMDSAWASIQLNAERFAPMQTQIDRQARQVFDLASRALNAAADSADALANVSEGTTTAAGEMYNSLFDLFGSGVAEGFAELADMAPTTINAALDAFSVLGDAVGDLITQTTTMWDGASTKFGAIAGAFMQGGVWGGLAAVVSQTENFKGVLLILEDAVKPIIAAAEPLAKELQPLAMVFTQVAIILAEALAPVLEALSPVLDMFFYQVKYFALGLMWGVKIIGDAWNGILEALSRVFKWFADVEFLGGHPFAAMGSFANSIRDGKIDMYGLNERIDRLSNLTLDHAYALADEKVAMGDLSDYWADTADAAEKATESLSNVPAGYKIALARFNATDAVTRIPTSGAIPGKPDGRANVTIGNVTVVTNDPEKLWQEFERQAELKAQIQTGGYTSSLGLKPYLAGRSR